MAGIPKRVVGPALVATGPTTVYTVPANTRTVLRHIHVQNPSGSVVTFSFSIGADAAGTRLWDAFSIPAAAAGERESVKDFFVYLPLEATEIVQLKAGTNNILTVTINGDVIQLS
jgi:hypothetical protein